VGHGAYWTWAQQIESWFRYHRKKIQAGTSDTTTVKKETTLVSGLFGKDRGTRVHQAIEFFQKRHSGLIRDHLEKVGYNSVGMENMPDAPDDWTDVSKSTHAALNKRNKSQKMQLRTRTIAVLWDAASPEEQAKCEEMVEDEKAELLIAEAENKLQEKTPASRMR
jgi:hypothetical protein